MKKINFILVLCFVFLSLKGQVKTDKKLGNPSIVSSPQDLLKLYSYENGRYGYSIEDYFRKPKQFAFEFSPNGLYVSYRKRDYEGKNHLYVKNTKTDRIKQVITEGQKLIVDYAWANNDRIIYLQTNGSDNKHHLFSVGVNGRNTIDLTPFKDVKVRFIDFLSSKKDHVIVSMNIDNKQIFEPYMININTGEYTKMYENKDVENPIQTYYFDRYGVLKAYSQQQNGTDYVIYYRMSEELGFEEVIRTTWKDEFYVIKFNYSTKNPHDAYIISNMDSDKTEIILYDFEHKKIIKELYSDKSYDISGLNTSSEKRNFEIDYFYYYGDKYEIVPVSKTYKKLYRKLKSEFGDKNIYIVSSTEKEDKYLLKISSDRLYAKYYVYNSDSEEFKLVIDVMPHLEERYMSEMKSFNFKSRDGLTIHAYLTMPRDLDEKELVPLIVLPHDGPFGLRDKWSFNSDAQLFASRGYATLQVNFRGSGGFGKEFYLAGNKQIGRSILEDIEDAINHVKKMNIIDSKKIGIFGTKFGGLACLGSMVKTPDLFACGVDFSGLSSLFTFLESFPPYWKPYLKQVREQWYDETNAVDVEIMKNVSPALNLDKITKPIFVIQGALDPRININETDALVGTLRNKNLFVPYMVKYDEEHGFTKESNKIEMYKCMMGFFAKYFK